MIREGIVSAVSAGVIIVAFGLAAPTVAAAAQGSMASHEDSGFDYSAVGDDSGWQ
ncbi:hypothetical protein ABZW18_25825 [Streptomyces sp. NPDC004647]|uniref:hypothetical protein n=1 Tax=Streptomyces sp. NPDC004647 TaxID=3154671 RepID=UPI0033A7B1EF